MKQHVVVSALRFFRGVFLVCAAGSCLISGTSAGADTKPCSTSADSQQLDYWLGNWKILKPGASGSGSSKVYRSLDQCLFIESWDNGKGHSGQNMFAYSPDDKTWYGMFADNEGRVHVFTEGKVSSGSAEFRGQSRGPDGEAVLNRVKVVRLAPDKVEQTWEKSTDNGSHWETVFRGEYSRSQP